MEYEVNGPGCVTLGIISFLFLKSVCMCDYIYTF